MSAPANWLLIVDVFDAEACWCIIGVNVCPANWLERRFGSKSLSLLPRTATMPPTADPLHCISLHCMELNWIALHCIGLHWIALYPISFHCVALHRVSFALHCLSDAMYHLWFQVVTFLIIPVIINSTSFSLFQDTFPFSIPLIWAHLFRAITNMCVANLRPGR